MDLLLDKTTGDLAVSRGTIPVVTGADAVAQRLRIRLSTVRGEWYQDQSIGVPYFARVLGKRTSKRTVEEIFRRVARTTPGVSAVNTVQVTPGSDPRSLSVIIEAVTVDGGRVSLREEIDL